jgi:hypothetical protein
MASIPFKHCVLMQQFHVRQRRNSRQDDGDGCAAAEEERMDAELPPLHFQGFTVRE